MLKYLRIAVTALGLAACVLLVGLWVRSYWWLDNFMLRLPNSRVLIIHSMGGQTDWYLSSGFNFMGNWKITSASVESLALRRPLDFPHWILVVLSATIAAAPWMRWRFGLRTPLLATALIAVGLGVIVVAN